MTMFSLLAVIPDVDQLHDAMSRFDADRTFEPYRSYIDPGELARARAFAQTTGTHVDPDDPIAVLSWHLYEDVRSELTDNGVSYYYLSTSNPEARFDGARIGGEWGWCFKPYDPDHPSLVKAEIPRWRRIENELEKVPEFRRTWVAGGPKGQLDIAGTRDAMAAEGARRWKEFAIGRPECGSRTWRSMAIPRAALLTLEGEWIEPGRGCSFGFALLDEHNIAYLDHVNNYIDNLPDDVCLVTVECHR